MNMFTVIHSYLQSFMLIMLPLAGMMLVFYSSYQLWRDLRGADKKKVRDRLQDDRLRDRAKDSVSILRSQSRKKLYETILEQIHITRQIQGWVSQANLDISGAKFLANLLIGVAALVAFGLLL